MSCGCVASVPALSAVDVLVVQAVGLVISGAISGAQHNCAAQLTAVVLGISKLVGWQQVWFAWHGPNGVGPTACKGISVSVWP